MSEQATERKFQVATCNAMYSWYSWALSSSSWWWWWWWWWRGWWWLLLCLLLLYYIIFS